MENPFLAHSLLQTLESKQKNLKYQQELAKGSIDMAAAEMGKMRKKLRDEKERCSF